MNTEKPCTMKCFKSGCLSCVVLFVGRVFLRCVWLFFLTSTNSNDL